jgi:ribonuclease HI
MTDSPLIFVYADESCLGNQFKNRSSPGGVGGLVEYWAGDTWVRRDYWISEPDTTNNRMALRSAIEGLSLMRKRPCRVEFVSDSQYLVKGMTEWVNGWKARGWKRKGGEIGNLELWQDLDRCAAQHQVRWHWVRGHEGHVQNEYADHLATGAASALTASGGLVESQYESWLNEQREKYGRYLDHFEHAPPK